MFLKVFIAILFLFTLIFTSFSHADEPEMRKIENEKDVVRILSGRYTKKDSTKKVTSLKDKHLNGDLTMLERSMKRKVNSKAFGDICKRYIGLTRQYGRADRAINFLNSLVERHPQSSNAITFSEAKIHSLREFEADEGFNQRLNLINSRLNLIYSQHGHDSKPVGHKEPVIN